MTTTVTVEASGREIAPAGSATRSGLAALVATVAHELNNPLTAVLGYAELLLADLPDDGHGRAELETIRDEAIRARGVVRALVDVARPRALDLASTDLNTVVRSAVDADRDRLASSGIAVRTSYGRLPTLWLDAGAIGRAVVQLAAGALAAAPEGRILRIETEVDGDHVTLTIAADGPGGADELRDRLVDPFGTTSRGVVADGLGLATALATVAAHGGSIDIGSAAGQGGVIEVRLPLHRPADPLAPTTAPTLR